MSQKSDSKQVTRIQGFKGMEDLLPAEARKFRFVEETARHLFELFGYEEIRTPILEPTELFIRTAGDASDVVVSKQMYTFTDAGDRSNTMRPEGTAGVVRALVEKGSFKELPQHKLFYIGPMFRYEKPQKGRQRQFHQAGIEFFGVPHPSAEVEVIALCYALLNKLGFPNVVTLLNTIGCEKCRPAYNDLLREKVLGNKEAWCPQCRERAITNPMRVFDCKVESCKALVSELPRVSDHVCEECETHFGQVKDLLDKMRVPYRHDQSLVRGFDYYTRTVFEVVQGNIGAQSAILGGGRYDNLVEELGGPKTPAVGMGIGLERFVLSMEAAGLSFGEESRPDCYAIALDEESMPEVASIVQKLRLAGNKVLFDCQPKSVKAGFKSANRSNAKRVVIIGSNELANNSAQIKDMDTGEQIMVKLNEL